MAEGTALIEYYRKRSLRYLLTYTIAQGVSTVTLAMILGIPGIALSVIPSYAVFGFTGAHREMELIAGEVIGDESHAQAD